MIFKIVSSAVMIAFYGCYFIKMLLQKRKGIQTDQLGKGKHGMVKYIEVFTKVFAFLVPFVEVLSIFWIRPISLKHANYVGAVISVMGVFVFFASVAVMKDNWRAGVSEKETTELVTGGIYSISRNPAFLGFDLVYIGILLMFFNWFLFAVTAVAVMMLHLQIVNVEEPFLVSAFGEEYLVYKKKVSRYIGRRIR